MKNFFLAFTMTSAVTLCAGFGSAEAQRHGGPNANEAIIYADPNFRGDAIIIHGAQPNLRDTGLNDKVSSIEVRGQWEICVDPGFRNRCTIIDGPVGHLSTLRMNDTITSLRPLGRGAPRPVRYDRDRGAHDQVHRDHWGGKYYGHNDGVKGRSSIFFPRPRNVYGERIKSRPGSAARFCRKMGYGSVLYANHARRNLTDVLCAR